MSIFVRRCRDATERVVLAACLEGSFDAVVLSGLIHDASVSPEMSQRVREEVYRSLLALGLAPLWR